MSYRVFLKIIKDVQGILYNLKKARLSLDFLGNLKAKGFFLMLYLIQYMVEVLELE